jgi:Anticodon-binding domain
VKWKAKTIIVMGEVMIDAPYSSSNCKLVGNGDNAILNRVKLVVENERRRLNL